MTSNRKTIYIYEDGVEEGLLPFNLNIFEYFSEDTVRSIRVEYFNNQYNVEVKLNPFYVSGKEIKNVMSVMDAETKQLFIENNVWILFLRYDDSQTENRKGNKMSVLCPYCGKEIEEAVCDFWLKNFVNYINNFNCPECGNDVEIDVEIEPTFTPYRKKNK